MNSFCKIAFYALLLLITLSLCEGRFNEQEFTNRSKKYGKDPRETFADVVDIFCCKCIFDRDAYDKLCMSEDGENKTTTRLVFSTVLRKIYNESDCDTNDLSENRILLRSMINSLRNQKWLYNSTEIKKITHLCCDNNIGSSSSKECLSDTFYNDSETKSLRLIEEQNGTCVAHDLSICNRHEIIRSGGVDTVSFWLIIGSCSLLGLTIMTYILLPTLLNVHGKCILCHLLFLLVFFMLQFAEQLYIKPDSFIKFSERLFSACWIVGFLMYSTSIAANLWLLAVNVDLYQTFTRKYIEDKMETKQRFRYYSVIVMGLTFLTSLIVLVAETTLPENSDLRPQIGCTRCFFPVTHGYSIMIYYYGLIAAILCLNLIIFTWTNYNLCIVQSQISRVKYTSLVHQGLERLLLFFKLFCVSGTAWIINLIFWIIKEHEVPLERKHEAARFFELFNVSHGFCYFIVFVCKPSIMKMFYNRYFVRTKSHSPLASVTTTLSSSSANRVHRVK